MIKEIPWLSDFSNIHEKWRNLNHDNPDPNTVKNLSDRLKVLEPMVEAFQPKSEEDWGNINLKKGVLYDIRCMKAYFRCCDITYEEPKKEIDTKLAELNKKYLDLIKKETDLKLELCATLEEIDALTGLAVEDGYNLSLDSGKWVKEG